MPATMRFYESEADFEKFCENLKAVACPHCRSRGCLIRHGNIYGYAEDGHEALIVRGHRVYCNKRRKKHKGCGGTIAVMAGRFLRGFVLTAVTLWQYLAGLARGMNKAAAFRASGITHAPSAAYRFVARVSQAQAHIRSFLIRHAAVPTLPETEDSLVATLTHLQEAFPDSACPILDFQMRFQVSFL